MGILTKFEGLKRLFGPDTLSRSEASNPEWSKGSHFLGYRILESHTNLPALLKACAAELLGTALFVFLATGCHNADVAAQSGYGNNIALLNARPGSCFLSNTSVTLNIALAFGFSIFVIVYFTASFSGGHINPAVTLGMFLTQRISLLRMSLYIIAQCVGAMLGSLVLRGLDSAGYNAAAGAANQVNFAAGTTVGTALGFEVVLTFALVFAVFAAIDTQRALSATHLPILAPFSIGMVVFICHLVAIPVDGTSLNPARSFGPAVVAHKYRHLWVFWIGPFSGAIAGAILYEIYFKSWIKSMKGQVPLTREDIEAGITPVPPSISNALTRDASSAPEQLQSNAGGPAAKAPALS